MTKFLLDANLSWETADFLRQLGYEAYTVAHFNLEKKEDSSIVQFAIEHNLTIITLDTDFGYLYYQAQEYKPSIIVLRIDDQTVESVNNFLARLHNQELLVEDNLKQTFLIVDESRVRVKRGSS